MAKRLSPFSIDFWINKGYSPEEAEYKRNSIRPIRKEYWLEKGYTETAAIAKADETKTLNNKKGAKNSANRPKDKIYESSIRRPEYWIKRGLTEDEAKEKVKESQALGSLDNFIKRHGVIDGTKKWKERQKRWQQTLNFKSDEEKHNINKNKNCISLKHHNSVDEAIDVLSKKRNMKLFKTLEDFKVDLLEKAKSSPYILYMPFDHYIKNYVPNIQLEIFKELNIDYNILSELFKDTDQFLIVRGNKQACRKWTKEGLLRSSYEIYFYDRCTTLFPECNIEIDNRYPDSNMRYDFKVFDDYIEICPMIHSNEKYKQKMQHKKKIFNCILLSSIEEIDDYLNGRLK